MNRKKKIIAVVFVIIVVAVGGYFYFFSNGKKPQFPGNVQFVPIIYAGIEETVSAQGKLEPKEYVDVGAQVSGQLKKIHVEIGDVVKAGDLLAEIDPKIYESRVQADEARLKTLQAQLEEQQAQVEFARQQFERSSRLIKSKAISQEAFEDSSTNLRVATAKLKSLEAQIEEAQSALDGDNANLGYTKIYAPMDGTIVTQVLREGQTINASQSAPTIVQVANLDVMTVRSQVAEADVMRLKSGMDVYFTTLGALDRKWEGIVRQILPSPEVVNDVVLYNVLIDVDNKDRQLMTGMSTQVFFLIGKADNSMMIPMEALGKRVPKDDDETGQAYMVKVQKGRNMEEKMVHIGLMSRNMAEVKSGLSPEDKVAIMGKKSEGENGRGNRPTFRPGI